MSLSHSERVVCPISYRDESRAPDSAMVTAAAVRKREKVRSLVCPQSFLGSRSWDHGQRTLKSKLLQSFSSRFLKSKNVKM